MKKPIINLFLLFLISHVSMGQFKYPDQQDAQMIMNSRLVVQIIDEKDDLSKIFNQKLKESFIDEWVNLKVEFLPLSEIDKINVSGNDAVGILTYSPVELRYRVNASVLNKYGTYMANNYDAFVFDYFEFNLSLKTSGKTKTVTNITMANGEFVPSDLQFLAQQLNHLITCSAAGKEYREYYVVQDKIDKIKNSTLLILEDFFVEKDIKKMASYYPYKYEVVNLVDQEEIVRQKSENICYLKIIWSDLMQIYVWITVDAQDGTILSMTSFGGIKFGRTHSANEIIKAKHLKYATNKMAQTFNTRRH